MGPSQNNSQVAATLEKLKQITTPIKLLEQKILTMKQELDRLAASNTSDIPSSSSLRYRCLGLVEEATRIMLQVDTIDSLGDPEIRTQRKSVIKQLELLIAEGEKLVAQVDTIATGLHVQPNPAVEPAATMQMQPDDAVDAPQSDDGDSDDDGESQDQSDDAETDCDKSDSDAESNHDTKETAGMDVETQDNSEHHTPADSDDDDDDDDDDNDEQVKAQPTHDSSDKKEHTPQKQTSSRPSPRTPHSQTHDHPQHTSRHHQPPRHITSLPASISDKGSHYLLAVELPPNTRPKDITLEPTRSHHHHHHHSTHPALLLHGPSFATQLRLPRDVDLDHCRAQLQDDVLVIMVAKARARPVFAPMWSYEPYAWRSNDPFTSFADPQFGW